MSFSVRCIIQGRITMTNGEIILVEPGSAYADEIWAFRQEITEYRLHFQERELPDPAEEGEENEIPYLV